MSKSLGGREEDSERWAQLSSAGSLPPPPRQTVLPGRSNLLLSIYWVLPTLQSHFFLLGALGGGRPVTPGSREEEMGGGLEQHHCRGCLSAPPALSRRPAFSQGCPLGGDVVGEQPQSSPVGAGCCWSMLGSPFGGGEGGGLPSYQGERWVTSSSFPFPPPGSHARLALAGRPGWPELAQLSCVSLVTTVGCLCPSQDPLALAVTPKHHARPGRAVRWAGPPRFLEREAGLSATCRLAQVRWGHQGCAAEPGISWLHPGDLCRLPACLLGTSFVIF